MNPLKIMKTQGRQAELENSIERLAKLRNTDDPRVTSAQQNHKGFETKAKTVAEQIERMAGEHVDLEKQSAAAMLDGTDPKIQRLTALGQRKAEAETEHRLMLSVIEQSREKVKEISAQVDRERDRQELTIVGTALDHFIAAFEPLLEAQAVLEKALNLQAISRHNYIAQEVRDVSDAYDAAVKFKPMIADLLKPAVD